VGPPPGLHPEIRMATRRTIHSSRAASIRARVLYDGHRWSRYQCRSEVQAQRMPREFGADLQHRMRPSHVQHRSHGSEPVGLGDDPEPESGQADVSRDHQLRRRLPRRSDWDSRRVTVASARWNSPTFLFNEKYTATYNKHASRPVTLPRSTSTRTSTCRCRRSSVPARSP
jgi:hypothetical protein